MESYICITGPESEPSLRCWKGQGRKTGYHRLKKEEDTAGVRESEIREDERMKLLLIMYCIVNTWIKRWGWGNGCN